MDVCPIKFLDLTFDSPAENLACDEALLDFCEETNAPNLLRFWEPRNHFVVVGYANSVKAEVNAEKCAEKSIPILRRCSGGGTVLQGPGCLNYSLILNFADNPILQTITSANQFIMEQHRKLLEKMFSADVRIQGHTDLTLGKMKFSGNAQRRKRKFLLFHGAFLLNFDIPLIEQVLKMPTHQPDYREQRSHETFLTNVSKSPAQVKTGLRSIWNATEELKTIPAIPRMLLEKYESAEWNLKF